MRRPFSKALIGLLRGYQFAISPMFGQTCRYYPSCSSYAIEAIRIHGSFKGTWLAIRRLARCHPWTPGGVDHVPPARSKTSSVATPRSDAAMVGGARPSQEEIH